MFLNFKGCGGTNKVYTVKGCTNLRSISISNSLGDLKQAEKTYVQNDLLKFPERNKMFITDKNICRFVGAA